MPAISRSLLVTLPLGLVNKMREANTSVSKFDHHTMGCAPVVSGVY